MASETCPGAGGRGARDVRSGIATVDARPASAWSGMCSGPGETGRSVPAVPAVPSPPPPEEEEEESWGAKKSAYYASNAREIESDDEEANELEEQEAKRLQAKMRDAMADDDFGLEDVVEGLLVDDG